jgi:hypothetical protein
MAKWIWVTEKYRSDGNMIETTDAYLAHPFFIELGVRQAILEEWWATVITNNATIELRNLESEEKAKQVAEELGDLILRTYK